MSSFLLFRLTLSTVFSFNSRRAHDRHCHPGGDQREQVTSIAGNDARRDPEVVYANLETCMFEDQLEDLESTTESTKPDFGFAQVQGEQGGQEPG